MAAYCKQHCSQPNIAAEVLTNAGLRHSLKRAINSDSVDIIDIASRFLVRNSKTSDDIGIDR